MTESQWRFLKAIAERVPEERIVELRLFPTIRQGGAESGVAVVAVEELVESGASENGASENGASENGASENGASENRASAEGQGLEPSWGAPPETENTAPPPLERHRSISTQIESSHADAQPADDASLPIVIPAVADFGHATHELSANGTSELTADAERQILPTLADLAHPAAETYAQNGNGHAAYSHVSGPHVGVAQHLDAEHEVALSVDLDGAEDHLPDAVPTPSLDDILDVAAASDASMLTGADTYATSSTPLKRYAVLAARYRLTLKGPERGKWDFEITHEADAPLDTVDRVARGVARRAGDEGEPESFTALQLRNTLAQPWWSAAT